MFHEIGKIRILVNTSFSNICKFGEVPALKCILTDPALGFFFDNVLHQLQFNILLFVCNLVETVLE